MRVKQTIWPKILMVAGALLLALATMALIAWPMLFGAQASAHVRSLTGEQIDEIAHSLGLHWNVNSEETPVIVDFGGASAAPIAGMDQWFARQGQFPLEATAVTGPKRVIVLRVYFNDYTTSDNRYSKTEVEGFFDELNELWKNTSYGKISIDYQVTDLFKLPDNRTLYIDDLPPCEPDPALRPLGDLSCGDKFWKVLNDSIANSPNTLDWTNIDAVMVVMAEDDNTQFHRGQGRGGCSLKMGPGGSNKSVGCAIFSENPTETDRQVWGRWAHEIGHAFQEAGPAHPSNYNSEFELMDSNYPGQTGVFEKLEGMAFPGWLPASKYVEISPANGGEQVCLWAMEYDPLGKPNPQAIKAKITDDLYYLISVRRRVLGDDLNGDFANGIPDEGVLIERVVVGGDPWVTLQAPTGLNRNSLWKVGQTFDGGSDGILIVVTQQFDEDNYCITVRYDKRANQPDVALHPWTSPPGDTWETTDIWVDSPVNGYDTYRYGSWNDLWGNPVPRGNGDDPAVGMVNRLYARVRNVGTQTATDVKVNWEITDPPGLGIAGANGWAPIGSVDKNQFPALASIAAGAYVDVYVEWTPNFALTPEQLAEGRFSFHTCVRVKLDTVAGETVVGNQDGDREQENINYFQAVTDGGDTAVFDGVIRLRNDDLVNKKYFYLNYETDVPDAWLVNVNNGVMGVELQPNEVREIPVVIKPQGPAVVGSIFGVDVAASSLEILANDLDPKDRHPGFDTLGGARVEARVLLPARLECKATNHGEIMVEGVLSGIEKFPNQRAPYRVMVQGVDGNRRFIPEATQVVDVEKDGSFQTWIYSSKERVTEVICFFAGTTELASASSGYIPVVDEGNGGSPTPTRTAVPTNTPVPTATPTTGPRPTATPEFSLKPFKVGRIIAEPILIGGTDLSLHGIEITQGIQCFDTSTGLAGCPDNSLPVVTNKSTAARVYIKYSNLFFTQRNNVPVRLFIRRDGGAWQSIDATGKGLPAIDQSQAANSANFYFTINGNSARVVDFYAVVDPNNVIAETNETNNRYPSSGHLTMTFRPRQGLDIAGSRLRWDPSGPDGPWTAGNGSGSGTAGWTVNNGSALWFNQLLPIPNGGVNYSVNSGYRNWTGSLNNADQHELIKKMNGEYVLALIFTLLFGGDVDDLIDHYYGWIPNNRGSFGHADMPVYPHAGGLGVVGIGTDDPGTSTDNPGAGVLIFGHELVHDYDILHTNTADACGSSDSNSDFPYGSSSIQEYGFNPLTGKVYTPETTHDLMSYCPSGGSKQGWISPFTWSRMFNNLNPAALAAARADGELIMTMPGGQAEFLRTADASSVVVNVTVYNPELSKQGGSLGSIYKVEQGYNLILPEGDHAVILRDANGGVLASRSFAVSFESEYHEHSGVNHRHGDHPGDEPGDPNPTEKADVVFVMPWIDGAASLALVHNGQVLDERKISDNAPTVTITSPGAQPTIWAAGTQATVQWTAADVDGDTLVYALFYSHNAGQNWQLLAEGFTETSYALDVDALAGGNDVRLRVVVSDGVNTSYDETDAAIQVPNKAPIPGILSPEDGLWVEPEDLVLLQGGATDLEDGSLPAESLHWRSDRQGPLGTGYSAPLTTLEPGRHVITLRATDSSGIHGETSLTVNVGYGIFLPSVTK